MDDEIARPGCKLDLTTRDEYLESRFTKLSLSGHDLTPMSYWTSDEIGEDTKCIAEELKLTQYINSPKYLGVSEKGLYVRLLSFTYKCVYFFTKKIPTKSLVGGLPLFSSGYRVDILCNTTWLAFTSPCDPEHIVNVETENFQCARNGKTLGYITKDAENGIIYFVQAEKLFFWNKDRSLPIRSQPANYWGTEGQFVSWRADMMSRPLSN